MTPIVYTLNCGNIICGKCDKTYRMRKDGFPPVYFMRHIGKCQHISDEKEIFKLHEAFRKRKIQATEIERLKRKGKTNRSRQQFHSNERRGNIRETQQIIQPKGQIEPEAPKKPSIFSRLAKCIERNLFTTSYRRIDEQA